MIGVVIAILVLVALNLFVTILSGYALANVVQRSISRQDDRVRKRLERQVHEGDEDDLGQLVRNLRNGETLLPRDTAEAVAEEILERHPEAKWPSDL